MHMCNARRYYSSNCTEADATLVSKWMEKHGMSPYGPLPCANALPHSKWTIARAHMLTCAPAHSHPDTRARYNTRLFKRVGAAGEVEYTLKVALLQHATHNIRHTTWQCGYCVRVLRRWRPRRSPLGLRGTAA